MGRTKNAQRKLAKTKKKKEKGSKAQKPGRNKRGGVTPYSAYVDP